MSGGGLTERSGRWSLLGNLSVVGALLVLAALLLLWQPGSLVVPEPGSRVLWAFGIAMTYTASCTLFLLARIARDRSITAARPATDRNSTFVPVLVAFASQTGCAEQLALQTAESLRSGGIDVEVRSFRHLDREILQAARRALFIASTTGEGDPPDMAAGFVGNIAGADLNLGELHYGVLALGDSDYTNFCAFGKSVEAWLRDAGAHALFDTIQVDDGDAGALRHWQYHLGQLSGRSDLPDWQVPHYSLWTLVERRVLNPGSVGDPCFHIALRPNQGESPDWQAGDIVEIGPQQASSDVDSWLQRHALDGDACVSTNGRLGSLREVVARSSLGPENIEGTPQQVADILAPLPHRDYSIASTSSDGRIELLLRQWRRSDGSLGLGTGWLTEFAEVGAEIRARIRKNNAFHPPQLDCPLLLIGNGTGIASLRAILKQRIAENRNRNWLIFGERNANRDFHYRDEILAWKERGMIERLDLAFSRDQPERIYVQHRLEAAADQVREWVGQGAEIMVCGSLEGMAPGVDAALRRILGGNAVEELIASARYRRDVY